MILPEKIARLKHSGLAAVRLAMLWEEKISVSGVEAAEDLYFSLGHNHIERKGVEWEGLKLSREPKEHEKTAVKGVHGAQESAKESIGTVLLNLRTELISDGLEGIKKLKPASYHELTLQASSAIRTSLRDRLIETHRRGRLLVAAELGRKEAVPDDEFDDLDELTDLTDSRIANDVQSRIIAAATRFRLLGLAGAELLTAIQNEITAGSVSYIDRAATGLANKVINIGRMDEAERRRDDWERVEYSALLDQNVCGPCASEDGQEAQNEADLTPVPNPSCEGGDWCRCFHVYVNQ